MSMTVIEQIQSVLAATLKVAPSDIRATTTSDDLEAWDSLGQVKLIMALEQAFNVEVEVDDFGLLASVPAIAEYLSRRGVV